MDRIFIGISFPLFSNNWGAAFLRHLLGLIKPNGAVILPVYPEVQARDQGLWCRSSLENIFRSRSRYIGISNIWAENDGVMSMRDRTALASDHPEHRPMAFRAGPAPRNGPWIGK